ncbi:MAG: cytochrome-c peroxidase [Bacteroidales bacterium]|jgi:cytochrome c peroxidase|nr:cytochrome-c peroxidase [Bacteroidales bacterium]MDN5350401.1 cytochrome c peroxidase [Bacteroidales bacterium]
MNHTHQFLLGLISAVLLLLSGCSDKTEIIDPPPSYAPTPYELEIPYAFPTKLNIPEDNPLTVEGVELGRYLFYDGRLSGRTHPDSLMSCATCHIQENNFEPGVDHPVFEGGFVHGLSGQQTHHVVLPLVNLVWNSSGYSWNGSFYNNNENPNQRQIEDIVTLSVVAPDEMYSDTSRVKALFQTLNGYPELFYKAFGSDQVTFKNMARAIAQFVRTLVSANAKIDRYLRGEEQLTQSELNGFILFTTEEGADCFHCHGGFGNPLFTTHLFYNNGKDTIFDDPFDRFSVSGDPMHKGAYKAPTLRNISLSGPYMHDGRFATLDEVIQFYSHEVKWSDQIDPLMHHVLRGGVQLTPSEKADLKAFIATLHDESFLTNPAYSRPEKFPDED